MILMLFTVSFAFLYKISLGRVIVSYLLLNLAYSGLLKRIVILDVMSLSIGFVLRAWAGAVVIGVLPSHWLQLSLFFLALFLSLTKRRQEMIVLHEGALKHRGVLSNYNSPFIDQLSAILTTAALLCYALYAVSGEVTERLGQFGFVYTVPFVVYGIFRYLYLVHVKHGALDPTEALFSDLPLLLSVIAWVTSIILTLYR
jgi:4-hydroxybenzoate polyprenyltransferase